jgi:hypothetical protein
MKVPGSENPGFKHLQSYWMTNLQGQNQRWIRNRYR